jgi:hypothetical protein
VRIGGLILDLPRLPGGRGYARWRVDVRLYLDGRITVRDGERVLLEGSIVRDPARLRSLEAARPALRSPDPQPAPRSARLCSRGRPSVASADAGIETRSHPPD